MSEAVPRATGHPVGVGAGSQRRPQQINFGYLDGLSMKVDREIRATEDALVDFIASEERRKSLYESSTGDLENRYPAMRKEGSPR